jgi:Transposase domain (DUF772)
MEDRRKNYRAWDAQQGSQKRVSPQEALPEGDLVFFLLDTIPQLDLSAFHQHYAQEMRGQPPFDVTMMVTLLVYAYAVGVCSSRKIAAACERNLAFRAIVDDAPPDFRTVKRFSQDPSGGVSTFLPRSVASGRREGNGQTWESVHRRDQDGCKRLAAQSDELRLPE